MTGACSGEPAQGDPGDLVEPQGYPGRAPVERPLRDLLGIASNPGNFATGGSEDAVAKRRAFFDAVTGLGIHRVRRDFRWEQIEAERGKLDFGAYDPLVDEAASRGIELLGTLDYGTSWAAASGNASSPPDDPADYAAYAAATAAHFAGRVSHWEVWNEPNHPRFWIVDDMTEGPARYAELLLATRAAIAGAAPNAQVLFGGTTFTQIQSVLPVGGVQFISEALEANAAVIDSYDIAAIHTYMWYPPRAAPEESEERDPSLEEKIWEHAKLQHDHDADDKPLWITEMGWAAYKSLTHQEQARYAVRSTILALRNGAEAYYWYTIWNDGPEVNELIPEEGFGLLEYDPDLGDGVPALPKPAYTALQTLVEIVGDRWPSTRAASVTGLPADGHAIVFEAPGLSPVTVVWTVEGEADVEFGREMEIVGMLGTPLGRSSSATVGPDVVYAITP